MLFREEAVLARGDRLEGEVVFANPLSFRTAAYAIGLLVSLAAIWIAIAEFTRTETVPGILTTTNPSVRILPSSPGIVVRLAVVEGASVDAGATLAVVSAERTSSVGTSAAAESLASVNARVDIGKRQIMLASDRARSERLRLQSVIDSTFEQIGELNAQIALQKEVIDSNKQLFVQLSDVVQRGFVSRVEYERRRQALLSAQQALRGLLQQVVQSRSQIAQARAQLASLEAETSSRIEDIHSSNAALLQQEAQLQEGKAYIVRAPVTGTVAALQTALGRTVSNDIPMMTIVPRGARLQAELYAPSRAIGFVRIGQEARLLIDAFPYQRFGSAVGRVSAISKTIIDPRSNDVPVKLEEPVYRVNVAMDQQSMAAFGTAFPFQPGMTLKANLVLDRQSFLEWLLVPVRAVTNRT